jgi:hypothetical protein
VDQLKVLAELIAAAGEAKVNSLKVSVYRAPVIHLTINAPRLFLRLPSPS